ncbi:hypothetical protein GHT07_09600 [Caenimonas koreensis DSM 17982]|uniref:Uncharacterized protein n=1 Tax=Caenimonas koreensis DSM 17982 TaxID=1121255 RepID=A0A844B2P8_9BURK|nr:hypothetical protein [Caenimonas koreensis]MRD47532.1 hypothetical protein [Caenimonas koreensis DSM 17982]
MQRNARGETLRTTEDAWHHHFRVTPGHGIGQDQINEVAREVPLAPSQLSDDRRMLADFVSQKRAGIWNWAFQPLLHPRSGPREVLLALKRTAAFHQYMPESQEALLGMAEIIGADAFAHCPEHLDSRTSQFGGTEILLCSHTGWLRWHKLNMSLGVWRFVLSPGPKSSGPYGAWSMWRGPNHPHVLALGGAQAWFVANERGPVIRKVKGMSAIRLFPTKQESEKRSTKFDGHCVAAQGADLLRICSLAERIILPDGQVFQTRDEAEEYCHPAATVVQALVATFTGE